MNYKEAMDYIKNTAKFGSNYGLERTEKILEYLGDPHKSLNCIHIAGTNGKGSTTAMISSILKASGYKVGMYTSPYLEEFEERIQINGSNIPKERLCDVVLKVSEAVEKVIAQGYDHPTEFEIITSAMFLYFYEENIDFAVVEVGLGGRLDSTNVLTPLVSVITSISYDHMNILGSTLKEIASEKAGIIKTGVPVVSYPQLQETALVLSEVSKEKGCQLIQVRRDCGSLINVEGIKQNINIKTYRNQYSVNLALLGEIQILNCAVAVSTIEALIDLGVSVKEEAIYEGLSTVVWKGRMEVMGTKPFVLLDGAHNIDGIDKLSKSIDTYFMYNKLYLIIGILADKQLDDMIKLIATKAKKVIAVTPNSERAEAAEVLRDRIIPINPSCEAFISYEKAFKHGYNLCDVDDLLVICGSLYMVGDMRKTIKRFL